MRRLNEEKLTQKKLELCPSGRKRKGRPRNSWMQIITTEMREKGSIPGPGNVDNASYFH